MNFDLVQILTRAGQITWKHKILWAFFALPLLASFLGLPFIAISTSLLAANNGELPAPLALLLAVVFFVLVIFMSLISMTLSAFAMSAVTAGIVRAERGADRLTMAELIESGRQFFLRILGVMAVIGLTVGLAFFIFFLLMIALILVTMGIASICMQPIMLLLSPLSFLLMAVTESAQAAVVTENMNVMDAIKRGWNVVKENIWKYLILVLIVYFGSSILMSLIMFPMMLPMMAAPLFVGAASPDEFSPTAIAAVFACFICLFFPVIAILQSAIGMFMKSSLCITYLRLTAPQTAASAAVPPGN